MFTIQLQTKGPNIAAILLSINFHFLKVLRIKTKWQKYSFCPKRAKCGLETCVTLKKRIRNNIYDTTSLIFFRLNAKCDTTCHCYAATVMSEDRRHGRRRRDTRAVCAWEGGQSSEWRGGLAKKNVPEGRGRGIQRHLLKIQRYYISPEARKEPIQSGAGGGGRFRFLATRAVRRGKKKYKKTRIYTSRKSQLWG